MGYICGMFHTWQYCVTPSWSMHVWQSELGQTACTLSFNMKCTVYNKLSIHLIRHISYHVWLISLHPYTVTYMIHRIGLQPFTQLQKLLWYYCILSLWWRYKWLWYCRGLHLTVSSHWFWLATYAKLHMIPHPLITGIWMLLLIFWRLDIGQGYRW